MVSMWICKLRSFLNLDSTGAPVGMGTGPHQVLAATLTLLPTIYWCPHQVLKATGAPAFSFHTTVYLNVSAKGFFNHLLIFQPITKYVGEQQKIQRYCKFPFAPLTIIWKLSILYLPIHTFIFEHNEKWWLCTKVIDKWFEKQSLLSLLHWPYLIWKLSTQFS